MVFDQSKIEGVDRCDHLMYGFLFLYHRKNKELNEILADLKEKGRQLESREEHNFDREDELMTQIYQKEVLVKHQEQIAEQYEAMEIELENTLTQLQGKLKLTPC